MILRAISIDDDPISIMMVKKLAESVKDLELVSTYDNPIEGAAGIILDRPDLLFLDIEMPDFNGVEIMRSLVKPPKIIVISGNPSFREKSLELKAVAFISKPADEQLFAEAVEKVREICLTEKAGK